MKFLHKHDLAWYLYVEVMALNFCDNIIKMIARCTILYIDVIVRQFYMKIWQFENSTWSDSSTILYRHDIIAVLCKNVSSAFLFDMIAQQLCRSIEILARQFYMIW